jgi:hypothetical protein
MTVGQKILLAPLVLALSVVAVPIIALAAFCWLVGSVTLVVAISVCWIPRGRRFLVVYSESAQWKSYFEDEILPAFGTSAQVINLSRDGGRQKWWCLGWAAYRHCAGYRNRFPAVYRFSLFGPWRSLRFYEAYLQSKKGKSSALEKAKADLRLWIPRTHERPIRTDC